MRKTIIVTLIALASVSATAAETTAVYEGRGNIYKTGATLADLRHVETELNKDTNGNSVAIKVLAEKTDATNFRVDVVAVQANANSQNIKDLRVRTNINTAAIADHETRITGNTNQVNAVQYATKSLQARADDSDLAMVGVQQVNQRQDIRLAQQDAVNEALSTSVAGLYTDMSGLRGEVRQARREAKEAKAGAAVALAVAAQQFSTDRSAGFQTAVSASTVGGYQALAVGVGGAITETVFVNGALSKSSNQPGAALSVTKRW